MEPSISVVPPLFTPTLAEPSIVTLVSALISISGAARLILVEELTDISYGDSQVMPLSFIVRILPTASST